MDSVKIISWFYYRKSRSDPKNQINPLILQLVGMVSPFNNFFITRKIIQVDIQEKNETKKLVREIF